MTGPRVVSLVPSTTAALAALGVGERVVGVTEWCVQGAPTSAVRVGGTKDPSVAAIAALRPDVVLANREENRRADVEALRAAGLAVHVSEPRSVPEAVAHLHELVDVAGADAGRAERLVEAIERARAGAAARRPTTPVPALVLVWRRPWMAVGTGTYAASLLADCGFTLVVEAPRYPRVRRRERGPDDGEPLVRRPQVVLLPSEPYAFTAEEAPAVREELVGPGVRCELVDGQLLTWHGPSSAPALDTFSGLAARLAGAQPDAQ